MCEPVSIGFALVSAATAMYSMREQTKATNRQLEAEMQSAEMANTADRLALQEQSEQISAQAQDQKLQRERDGLRERATMRANSSQVAGNSVSQLFNTSYFNEDFDKGTIEKNKNNMQMQNYRDLEKVNATYKGRINNAKSQWISKSRGNTRLAISGIGSGFSTYGATGGRFGMGK